MKVIYNARAIEEKRFSIKNKDRCFQYGDGLFETIIYQNGKIQFLERHLERLKKGMEALNFNIPALFSARELQDQILELLSINQLSGSARIKLQVWRKDGGLYTPVQNEVNYLITTIPFENKGNKIINSAGFSIDVKLYPTKLSRFKTCNALFYILAGIERQKRKLDDLILLDHQGNIAECTSANIFWLYKEEYYTPSTATGCIEGIMRGHLIEKLRKHKKLVYEVKESKESLLKAEKVFICNVTGVFPVKMIEGKVYNCYLDPLLKE